MKLMQELTHLREGAVKGLLMGLIEDGIKAVDSADMSHDDYVYKIATYVRAKDKDGVAKNMSDEALRDLIKTELEDERLREDEEAPLSAEDPAGTTAPTGGPSAPSPAAPATPAAVPDAPRVLKVAGNFKVLLGDNEQVSITDQVGNVKLSMPLVIWRQLAGAV